MTVYRPPEAPSEVRLSSVRLRWSLSFYDALIVASARHAGCDVLYTEDLQHGQELSGLRVIDPFRPTPQPE